MKRSHIPTLFFFFTNFCFCAFRFELEINIFYLYRLIKAYAMIKLMTGTPASDGKHFMRFTKKYVDVLFPVVKMRSILVLFHADNQSCNARAIIHFCHRRTINKITILAFNALILKLRVSIVEMATNHSILKSQMDLPLWYRWL